MYVNNLRKIADYGVICVLLFENKVTFYYHISKDMSWNKIERCNIGLMIIVRKIQLLIQKKVLSFT